MTHKKAIIENTIVKNAIVAIRTFFGLENHFFKNSIFLSPSLTRRYYGIDVSEWQGGIDWEKVRATGISFAMIRCGFRQTHGNEVIEDGQFRQNIEGATKAGLRSLFFHPNEPTKSVCLPIFPYRAYNSRHRDKNRPSSHNHTIRPSR